MKFCDIGVNLTNNRFRGDLDQVLADARLAGVEQVIITGTNEQESRAAFALTKRQDMALYSTAGVHPHDADHVSPDWEVHLEDLLALPRVVAAGECGLDFNRNFSSRDGQLKVFEAQLELAVSSGKPVFLHERDAFDEQLSLLSRHDISHGVAHCFTGNKDQMQAYLDLGLYIGVTGWICDPKRGVELREAATQLPLDRLLLETDAPYLVPKNATGRVRRNEPKYLPLVAQVVAELQGISLETVAQASYDNARKLFSL